MGSSSIELKGSKIERISVEDNTVKVYFSEAILIKTMTGAIEKTRWKQAGYLIFEEAELEAEISLPAVCAGGDIGENIYTYRDMIPIPLDSHGQAHCDIYFEGNDEHLRIQGSGVKLEMLATPKYIEHIKET